MGEAREGTRGVEEGGSSAFMKSGIGLGVVACKGESGLERKHVLAGVGGRR